MNEEQALREVRDHKDTAKTATKFEDYDEALAELKAGIQTHMDVRASWGGGGEESELSARVLKLRADVIADLADALGMRGGVLRRMGDEEGALQSFLEGSRLELNKDWNVMSSYATVNAQKMTLLDRDVLPRDDVPSPDDSIEMIRKQVKGRRAKDRWAWSDLGDCYLMKGESAQDAIEAYRRFAELSNADHLESAHQVLAGLYERMSKGRDPRAEPVKQVVDYLDGELDRA